MRSFRHFAVTRWRPQLLRDPSARFASLRMTATLLVGLLVSLATLRAPAAEIIPPKPPRYFNDYTLTVSSSAISRFNEELAQFERDTSNQVVVAIFAKMQTDSDIADYTQRIAQAWGVGQKDRRNGVVLFVFKDDRKMFIQVGYGLEGVLPDTTAFDITERHIKPKFRANDFEGGLATGIDLIEKALRGEYKGTGRTVAESENTGRDRGIPCVVLFIGFVIFMIVMGRITKRGRRRGWGYTGMGGPFIGGWGSGSSGGGWSSGSSGGGFSGGGGSFGGGGAGSSW